MHRFGYNKSLICISDKVGVVLEQHKPKLNICLTADTVNS